MGAEYFKFPSTKYITFPGQGTGRGDKVMPSEEVSRLLAQSVTVEEKIDGANLGISFDENGDILLQNRVNWLESPLEVQWKPLKGWIQRRQEQLFDGLFDRYILFGEWCYATHTVYYNRLPDYFIGFDVFDKIERRFFSADRRNDFLDRMGISIICRYGRGIYTLEELSAFFGKSHYGDQLCEGIYIRRDEGDWLKSRAKMVRSGFQQSIGVHWRNRELRVNRLGGKGKGGVPVFR